MKKALSYIRAPLALPVFLVLLAACWDLTGPQGAAGVDGEDAEPYKNTAYAVSAALEAKTGGGD